ncbi:hypothetical protein OG205_20465 [Lentzea sp. NBC_00516]|uniref:CATRA system-associated protein n=1 Tax=Lentzea sp. NBC_00516 TaxID=2903582 RepID=UPI002E820CC0|nr:CATRA system-associated protein [Lentzea sp. NBC_00516]WUD29294.1 hypothetical protein OG205_20465 [Lentzea sp. NBC_00516]
MSARDEILSMLNQVSDLRLSAERWQKVTALLHRMESARAANDLDGMLAVVVELEMAARRIPTIGSEPAGPPPPPVRDRLNQLVHALGGDQGSGPSR